MCVIKYRGILNRLVIEDKQTLGSMVIYCDTDIVFTCKTLELPWLNNERFISCIPDGDYIVEVRVSDSYGKHWNIKDVDGRDLILIHFGNFHDDTEGCVIVGVDHLDIDGDGYRDVTSSVATMNRLNTSINANKFKLKVVTHG